MNREPLFFENSEGKERVIAQVHDMEEAFKEMHKFCEEMNFHIHYTRFYIEDCLVENETAWRITFDVGSWSEFFHIYFNTYEQAETFRKTMEFKKPF